MKYPQIASGGFAIWSLKHFLNTKYPRHEPIREISKSWQVYVYETKVRNQDPCN